MRPVTPEPEHIDRLRPRERVWVVPAVGEAWQGRFYRVENDSLFLLQGKNKRAIGLEDIDSLSVRRISPGRTAALCLGIGGGLATVAVLAATGIIGFESVDQADTAAVP